MEQIFYNPVVNLFLFLYKNLGENFILTIVLVTLVVQLLLWPLSIQQYKASKKMKAMQEKLKVVQDKKSAGKELNVAEMQMATQAFKGMCAGCLPSLIQLPFLLGLFNMFNSISTNHGKGTIFNNIAYSDALKFPDGYQFHLNVFGLDLSKKLFDLDFSNIGPVIVMVLIIIGTFLAQYYSIKISTPQDNKKDKNVQEIDLSKGKKNKKEASSEIKDPVNKEIAASPEQMQKIITGVILIISVTSAAALSVYWLARSLFVIILTLIQKKYIIKD